jgi:hypothetical protein
MTHSTTKRRKQKPKNDDPEEYKRFLETAKAVEADEDADKFDRAFKKVVPPKKRG